jgi:hypothetical protein
LSAKFDYSLPFDRIDFRRQPQRYRIGRGEQGVLLVEPYKSELLPHWRFRTPAEARRSATRLFGMFRAYGKRGDFVGMDMARKFLQMGYTRARRYANRKSGRKYLSNPSRRKSRVLLPPSPDPLKARSAGYFYARWRAAAQDKTYLALMRKHRERYERTKEKGARGRLS